MFRVNSIALTGGPTLDIGALTVVVGPNNSGKSQLLKDINAVLTGKLERVLVEHVDYDLPSSVDELKSIPGATFAHRPDGYWDFKNLAPEMIGEYAATLGSGWEAEWEKRLPEASADTRFYFTAYFAKSFFAHLLTDNRLLLANEVETTDAEANARDPLNALYRASAEAKRRLSELVYSAFGLNVLLDYSRLSKIALRIGPDFSGIPERLDDARAVLSSFGKVHEQGDGIRSFVGTLVSLLSSERQLTLLDEPEAFLHPPQAMRMGEIIAQLALPNRQFIVATHSADLLRGILNRRLDVTLVRLVRKDAKGRLDSLDPEHLARIARDPLLGSARAIEGMFYDGVVAVEADADRAFYQKVGRQIRPGGDIHYTHAHGKHALKKLVEPYRRLGVDVAAVVDFDILREELEFKALLEALTNEDLLEPIKLQRLIRDEINRVPASEGLHRSEAAVRELLRNWPAGDPEKDLEVVRRELERIRRDVDSWSEAKKHGFRALSSEGQAAFSNLNEWCCRRGLFIVPVGELESLMEDQGVPRTSNKALWIEQALTKLEAAEPDTTKLPWSFAEEVHRYLLG